jgi:TonB family protein
LKPLELWIAEYVLNALWQLPLVFAASWTAARIFRRAGAQFEHRIWVGALLLEATLPAFHFHLTELLHRVKVLLAWNWGGDAIGGHTQVAFGGGVAGGAGWLRLPSGVLTTIVVLFAGFLLYFLGRLAWGAWMTVLMRRKTVAVRWPADRARVWEQLRKTFELQGDCREELIGEPVMIPGPMTVGVFRQVLLVPAGFLEEIDETELEAVLAHEFAHMTRWDFAKNLIYEVLSLGVAYHPVLWQTRSRLAESRELVCDRVAAEAMPGGGRYVRSLLRVASMLSDRPPTKILHAIGIFDANTFERRVMNLTNRSAEVRGGRRFAMVAACVVIGAATCVSALALRIGVTAGSAQSQAPKALSVSADVMEGNIISRNNPVYPAEAKAKKDTLDGSVVLSVLISKEGIPVKVFVKHSLRADYDQSAIDGVREWRWKPFLLNGDPTAVKTTITVNYTMVD